MLIVLVLFLYVVIPQFGGLRASFEVMAAAAWLPLLVASGVMAVTFIVAALLYIVLSPRHLPFWRTVCIQVASAFTNRLLPAGLGALTLYVQYLRRQGYSGAQAVAIGTLNNGVGIVAHGLLLIILFVFFDDAVPSVPWSLPSSSAYVLTGLLILCMVTLLSVGAIRRFILRTIRDVFAALADYRSRPWRIVLGVCVTTCLTLLYVAVLVFSARAAGLQLSVSQLFAVFTIGMFAATVTPTPGGLVGAEAGLVAGMAAYGTDPAMALAVALLFRLITYWLPILPGLVMFLFVRRRYIAGL